MAQNMQSDYVSIDDRVSVRYATEQDAEFFAMLAGEPDVHRYIPWAKIMHAPERAREMLRNWAQKRQLRYVIEQGGQTIGYIGFWPDHKSGYLQVGYAVLPAYRGQQIVGLVLVGLERELLRLGKVQGFAGYVDPHNLPSKRVLVKSGYVYTGQKDDQTSELRYEKTIEV